MGKLIELTLKERYVDKAKLKKLLEAKWPEGGYEYTVRTALMYSLDGPICSVGG